MSSAPPLDITECEEKLGARIYASSVAEVEGGGALFIARRGDGKVLGAAEAAVGSGSGGSRPRPFVMGTVGGRKVDLYELNHQTASAVRGMLPWTAPVVLGTATSAGLGDRLGIAGPGHVRAARGTGVRPILAQQSIRELARTERTPEAVVDAATWAVLQEGWKEGYGSDADHLKTFDDADVTVRAGFTMFTIDPSDYVCDKDLGAGEKKLRLLAEALPWNDLETTAEGWRREYADKTFEFPGGEAAFTEKKALRAAVKYGRAVAHTAGMARRLAKAMGSRPWELEMSVDETDTPTTPEEHFFIARELARLGVKLVGLAPRFVGDFEKGVDYKGNPGSFRKEANLHAAIARHLGPYKLSIHSGSDKFSIYSIAAEATDGLVHLKTAGTSYLEALRVVARADADLFREILAFARERWPEDRATYHVSAKLSNVKEPGKDSRLEELLDQDDPRQVLHCTFGSVLTAKASDGAYLYRDRIYKLLNDNEEAHYGVIERHLRKHLEPFVRRSS